MNCDVCKGPMKPLFTGHFCPNDCDRPGAKPAMREFRDAPPATLNPNSWNFMGFPMGGIGSTYAPKDDQCRDAMCRGKAHLAWVLHDQHGGVISRNYTCGTCSKQHAIKPPKGTP